MSAQAFYEKALRCYLLTKYTPAVNNCLKAISYSKNETVDSSLLSNIWTLYINIATTLLSFTAPANETLLKKLLHLKEYHSSKQETCYFIWKNVADEGFQGDVSQISSTLISVCLAMALNLQQPSLASNIAEEWFSALPDHVLQEIAEGNDRAGYNDIVDQYIVNILPIMDDFDSALTFLEYNTIIPDARKKVLQKSVLEKKQTVEFEREKKTKLEEEARKLAIEEKRKAEEEKLRKEAESKRMKEREEEEARLKEQVSVEQRQKEIAAEEESSSKVSSLHKSFDQLQLSNDRSSYTISSSSSHRNNGSTLVQKWIKRFSNAQISKTTGGILIFIFALFALLSGQRGRLSVALQHLMHKLWETVKMGTKVTYI
ncbi:hypothetical protein BDF20DRAFT_845850 [Mycotypha africana]|uniref:uncharacterized protein n=1 Tax=Mycotypha africana TaxID=64632 RepID=UPI0023013447|nr:uncharacterized protein BDF20DRAFT_845850 [Mycotypha africana]KAI8991690.1 hypothetical protein BDF20DRAFT_845850 [Mycotypha africana]